MHHGGYAIALVGLAGLDLFGCKRQPIRSVTPAEDFRIARFLSLSSPDGSLQSIPELAKAPKCGEAASPPFFFVATDQKFYRCVDGVWTVIPKLPDPTASCRTFDLMVDVADTMGAEAEFNVKFFGMSCEESTVLIKEENGLIPRLASTSMNLGEKEVVLRSSFFQDKSRQDSPHSQAAHFYLERPTAMRWQDIPRDFEVSPGGVAGIDQFALLSLNSDRILCTYKSRDRDSYRLVGCWEGATFDARNGSGVTGGQAIDLMAKTPVSIDSIRFSIVGAEPGYITTAVVSIAVE